MKRSFSTAFQKICRKAAEKPAFLQLLYRAAFNFRKGAGLCWTWLETLKRGFLTTLLILWKCVFVVSVSTHFKGCNILCF